jgi:hypothetical protein
MPRDHDWGFFYWTAVGFLMSFGVAAILSIGFPFFVLGVVLLAGGIWKGPRWPADLGLIAGVGLVCLLIAALNAKHGDYSPGTLAVVGVLLSGGSSGVFWWLRRRPQARRAPQ